MRGPELCCDLSVHSQDAAIIKPAPICNVMALAADLHLCIRYGDLVLQADDVNG